MKSTSCKILKPVFIFFSLCILLSLLGGCSSGVDTANDSAYGTGSIAFGLAWEDGSSNSISSSLSKELSPGGDICVYYGIETITGKVLDSFDNVVRSESWPCSAHQGTIKNCPKGSNMKLVLEGIVLGSVARRGEKKGINVSAGVTTDAGTITMSPIVPDGTEKWRFATGDYISSSPAIGSDGTVYVVSGDNNLYAINPTNGTEKWHFATGGTNHYSSPAIGSDGTVYVGSGDSNLYAINPTNGTEKWRFATGYAIYYSSPAIGSDGTVYVGSGDSNLYAINPTNGTEK
jgi:hypothetical protein